MTERIVAPRLADIIEAIERIRRVLDGVTLEAFEQNWEKRWLVERGIEIISEASRSSHGRHKERRTEIPWPKVAGIGNVLRHAYDYVAPDVLWTSPFAESWKPPASSSSTRTAVAPVLGFENREKKSPANKPIRRMSRRT